VGTNVGREMARAINKLTFIGISKQSKPGYYGDGGGLWLQVSRTANPAHVSKSWIFRFTLRGKAQEMGFGPIHTVTLAEAREAATEARKQLLQGVNPIEHRRTARREQALVDARYKTFEWCATEYHKLHESSWKNSKHASQWINTLTTYAFPEFGNKFANDVTKDDILGVLAPLWHSKTETASRVRQRIRVVLDWAAAKDFRQNSPPRLWEEITQALPKIGRIKKVKSFAACPHRQVAGAVQTIRLSPGGETLRDALEFIVLTAARTGEVRGAQWSEFDLENAKWTVPADRMKAGAEHRIPLSPRALALVKRQKGKHETLVFPSDRGKAYSDMSFTMTLRRLGFDFTVHGFRSTFRDWSAEMTSYPREVCEAALAHTSAKSATEAAYFRSDLFEKRRAMMADWARYCCRIPAEVASILGEIPSQNGEPVEGVSA